MPTNAEIANQYSSLQKAVKNLLSKDDIDQLATKQDICDLNNKITANTEATNRRLLAVESSVAENKREIADNSRRITNQDTRIDDKLKELALKDLKRELYDRRLNGIFFGIDDKEGVYGDTCAECLKKVKDAPNISICYIYY